jgi:hypothetical protein
MMPPSSGWSWRCCANISGLRSADPHRRQHGWQNHQGAFRRNRVCTRRASATDDCRTPHYLRSGRSSKRSGCTIRPRLRLEKADCATPLFDRARNFLTSSVETANTNTHLMRTKIPSCLENCQYAGELREEGGCGEGHDLDCRGWGTVILYNSLNSDSAAFRFWDVQAENTVHSWRRSQQGS